MRRWLLLLGGPLIWAAHFAVIYTIASVSIAAAGETTPAARAAMIVAGGGGALACALLIRHALRNDDRDDLSAFLRGVGGIGAGISLVAILWQTLPAMTLS